MFICIQLIAFTGCNAGDKILSKDKMQDVLWDYLKAEAFTNDVISRDSSLDLKAENVKLQQQIFDRHHITKETFYNSFHYYESKPTEMRVLIDTLMSRQRRRIDKERFDTSRIKKIEGL